MLTWRLAHGPQALSCHTPTIGGLAQRRPLSKTHTHRRRRPTPLSFLTHLSPVVSRVATRLVPPACATPEPHRRHRDAETTKPTERTADSRPEGEEASVRVSCYSPSPGTKRRSWRATPPSCTSRSLPPSPRAPPSHGGPAPREPSCDSSAQRLPRSPPPASGSPPAAPPPPPPAPLESRPRRRYGGSWRLRAHTRRPHATTRSAHASSSAPGSGPASRAVRARSFASAGEQGGLLLGFATHEKLLQLTLGTSPVRA